MASGGRIFVDTVASIASLIIIAFVITAVTLGLVYQEDIRVAYDDILSIMSTVRDLADNEDDDEGGSSSQTPQALLVDDEAPPNE